jgi:hypothetical protein
MDLAIFYALRTLVAGKAEQLLKQNFEEIMG